MYNMEIYCTRSYCIENRYWTSRLRLLVQYGSSIQYRFVQNLSILYIALYNNLLIEKMKTYDIGNHGSDLRYAQRYGGVKAVYGFKHPLDDYICTLNN